LTPWLKSWAMLYLPYVWYFIWAGFSPFWTQN